MNKQTNKQNKRGIEGEHLVIISTLESSIGAGAEMEACLACGAGFVSCPISIFNLNSIFNFHFFVQFQFSRLWGSLCLLSGYSTSQFIRLSMGGNILPNIAICQTDIAPFWTSILPCGGESVRAGTLKASRSTSAAPQGCPGRPPSPPWTGRSG